MKILSLITGAFILVGTTLNTRAAIVFDAGSTGTYGELNVTTNTTLDLPPDGIFHCTTIHVAPGVTLRFNRNANNTPVYLLATSDVTIAGAIDVSGGNAPTNIHIGGLGGPGGFDGGWPGESGVDPGSGYGPGGGGAGINGQGTARGTPGTAGAGSYSSAAIGAYGDNWSGPLGYVSTNKGTTYGSDLLVPLVGGSGGGGMSGAPGIGGGGGGGAILLASNTRIDITGSIRADGGNGLAYIYNYSGSSIPQYLNPGSGGAIRLVAPAVAGTGGLSATGPAFSNPVRNHGRVRIDTIDRRDLNINVSGSRSVGSYMVVFPPSRLDILNVAGTSIFQGSGPVIIQLPGDSATNQQVTVQARGFGAGVPIQVALTPQSGLRTIYNAWIDNTSSDPASVEVPVSIPPNTLVTVEAWTKVP